MRGTQNESLFSGLDKDGKKKMSKLVKTLKNIYY